MIPRTAPVGHIPAWQHALSKAIRDPAELFAFLDLPASLLVNAQAASQSFSLLVPHSYARRMRKGDINDPLLRQVLPLGEEFTRTPGFGADPLGEQTATAQPGLLHKYYGRALLVSTGACAVHCRYCFRRHFPYGGSGSSEQWDAALAYLEDDPSITEIILSGGDPLVLSDRRLAALADRLAAVPHLRRLRIHTRLPIVLPERVDDTLLGWLTHTRLQPVMVVHTNHPDELDNQVGSALARLRQAGIPLFNQAVLLRGVNDKAATLVELSEVLFAAGVIPYYLHLLDRVQGAAHFEVPEDNARALHAELQTQLPGYLVPHLVREVAGAPGKVPVAPYPPAP